MSTTVLIECVSWLVKVTNNNDARWKREFYWKLPQFKLESYEQKLIIYAYPHYWSAGEVAAMSRRAFYRDILLLRCVVNTQHTHRGTLQI